jgi:translation elongation factor EF-G
MPDKKITSVTINYNHVTKICSNENFLKSGGESVNIKLNYKEVLTLDAVNNKIIHYEKMNDDYEVTKTIHSNNISQLFEEYSDAFYSLESCKNKKIKGYPGYEITVEYEGGDMAVISGSFYKDGLPDKIGSFINAVSDFSTPRCLGEMFREDLSGNSKKRGYVFCTVAIEGSDEQFYYRINDTTIKKGDFVLVPAGSDNETVIGLVLAVERYDSNAVPSSHEGAKFIIDVM